MKILIRSAVIVDPSSKHNGKKTDILIEDGIIKQVAKAGSIKEKVVKIIADEGLHISPGWFDMGVNFREPGFEYKEDLMSGCRAAAAGGFTGVLTMPSTHPPVHTKSQVEFIRNKTQSQPVDVFVAGKIYFNHQGEHLSWVYEIFCSGAAAFTDVKKPVQDRGAFLRSLTYAK